MRRVIFQKSYASAVPSEGAIEVCTRGRRDVMNLTKGVDRLL